MRLTFVCTSFLHVPKKCLFSIPLSYVLMIIQWKIALKFLSFLHFPSPFWPARKYDVSSMAQLRWAGNKKDTSFPHRGNNQVTLNISKITRISSVVSPLFDMRHLWCLWGMKLKAWMRNVGIFRVHFTFLDCFKMILVPTFEIFSCDNRINLSAEMIL